MDAVRVLCSIIKAGFLERSRRYSFFITLGFIVFIAYRYIPPENAGYLTLSLGNIRGIYNSAWLGAALAMVSSTLLSIPAFYLVKNSIERDRLTGVGQIIAATPMTKWMYTMGKMLSNFAVLAIMVFAIALSGLIMQLMRGENLTINILALFAPFVYSTLPTMIIVSALAIMFETIPLLQRSLGNIVYFFLWVGYNTYEIVIMSLNTKIKGTVIATNDLLGISHIIRNMTRSATVAYPDYSNEFGIGMTPVIHGIRTFDWQGIEWTFNMVVGRLLWVLAALLLASVSALFFNRFDTSRITKNNKTKLVTADKPVLYPVQKKIKSFNIYEKFNFRSGIVRILFVEMMLMLKGLSKWWYLIVFFLNFLALLIPIDTVQGVILPLTFICPLVLWSCMGMREKRNRTQGLIFTSPALLKHQFAAMLLSGIITTVLSTGGVLIRFAVQGMFINIVTVATAALFVSSLALVCGVLSGSSKLFEVSYMIIWYVGPLNHMEYFNFIGTTKAAIDTQMYLYYFIIGILLTGLAFIGRIRQTKHIN